MICHLYECNACQQRYPLVPYYRAAAPHGPDKDCRGEDGWTLVEEDYPPRIGVDPSAEQALRITVV